MLARQLTEDQSIALGLYLSAMTRLRILEGISSGFAHAARAWDSVGPAAPGDRHTTVQETEDRVHEIGRLRSQLEAARQYLRSRGGADTLGWLSEFEVLADDALDERVLLRSQPAALSRLRVVADHLMRFYRVGARR